MFDKLWQYYGFQDIWHPGWILVTVILACLYLLLVGPFRSRFRDAAIVLPSQKVFFLTGLLVNYITLGSPLELLSTYLFSAHSLQMGLFYFVMPPLLLAGIPAWMLRPILRTGVMNKMAWIVTRPMMALLIFNLLLSLYHLPLIYDFLAMNEVYDGVYHTVILVAALFMWWNIVCPLPEWHQLADVPKALYMFANLILISPACMVIMVANQPIYEAYLYVPRLFAVVTPLIDQKLGGLMMEVTQSLALGTAMTQMIKQRKANPKSHAHVSLLDSTTDHANEK